ncbi:Sugar kinase of the NBD/HSP70 family, may contain an N-terminal HTH domain [Streptomyces zhaozhouensis]|uniref:Sugar kinase of the NBD/HSP70 family, may contain an N-terminal HTH domain n=2 Tax=Streptomyces zhaozhouensis TaxID=1300267 RepID=A0A286DVL9_9ACTN|nr:Sugar kinase of the NBD/HSP70 family, may contain an N-terminal HTH domain [Streptomyces zhaozhouensis]
MAQPAPTPQSAMRQLNLSRVLHTLAAEGPLSRATVATRIGLTRAAVSTLVETLLRGRLLVEEGPGRSGSVGRPGSQLRLTDRGPCGFGAEIGVDHLAVCAADLRGEIRVRVEKEFRAQHRAPDAVLGELRALARRARAEADGVGLRPAGLAVAVPGLVPRGTTTVLRAPNLGWRDVELAGLLPADLGEVTVHNEASLGGLAELWSRGDPAADGFVYVSAQIGIGACVVLDGRLLSGAHGFAGELGHVPVRPEGPPCGCGGRGCLETYAGEEAVLRAAGIEPGPGVRLGALTARCEAGEPTALRAVRRAGTALGIALSGAVNLLDPRRVVIGGTLTRLAPWLLPPLRRELGRRTAVAAGGRETPLPVTASPLGPDGPLRGAAGLAVRTALDDPARLLAAARGD